MKDKKMYILLVISILFAVVGISLAFFSLNIIGNDTAKYNKITTGDLELVFTDDNEVSLDGAFPGDSITKTISVKNTGTKEVSYNIVWQELLNEITNNELVIDGTCKNLNSSNTEDGECSAISKKAVKEGNITSNIPIKPGYTQEYEVKITFIDIGKPQNYNKNKSFKGKLGLTESSVKTIYCTYDGELTQGAEYVNGQYTYRYMQESNGSSWKNITISGWGVQLTDKTSTDAVTSKPCTYINDKPVVSMAYMFFDSQATTLDLSNFDTSKVTNMESMFAHSQFTLLNLNNFNTSKVTNMTAMFYNSQATTLDLNSFNTSKVTNMYGMFSYSKATTIDVSNFDTSNVISMKQMFANSMVKRLDVRNFDTSNVTDMNFMFGQSSIIEIKGINNFNTSKVTDMSNMFRISFCTTLDVSSFDTSNVTDMSSMFYASQATTLDVSNFNTKNVTNMYGMFQSSKAKTIVGLQNFDTSNVTGMQEMFSYIQATTIDVSNFDTRNVTNMNSMFENSSNLKTIYVSNKFDVSKVTNSTFMFLGCTNLVGGAGTKYDSTKVDKTYARIDGGTSSPGYFTAK